MGSRLPLRQYTTWVPKWHIRLPGYVGLVRAYHSGAHPVDRHPVKEAAIISTCNRTEVYCHTAEPWQARACAHPRAWHNCRRPVERPKRRFNMFKPVDVRALPHYRLWLRYSDGMEGEVDLSDLLTKASLNYGMTTALSRMFILVNMEKSPGVTR